MLSSNNLEIQLPEATYHTIEEFKGWYETVTNLYFNEVHDIKVIDIAIDGNEAEVNLIVNWQTQIWESPAAKSTWKGFDCYQKWILTEDADRKNIVIKKYIAEKLVPMEGSGGI